MKFAQFRNHKNDDIQFTCEFQEAVPFSQSNIHPGGPGQLRMKAVQELKP